MGINSHVERIPLRLSDSEREQLQLVVAALKVSEYTDEVDDYRFRHQVETRMIRMLRELFGIITGLTVATGTASAQVKDLISQDTNSATIQRILSSLFEILRRHKWLNHDANRSEYGKLVMALQDTQKRNVRNALRIQGELVVPVRTVEDALKESGLEKLLNDDTALLKHAAIGSGPEKASAMKTLLETYGKTTAQRSVIERCVRSIDDVDQLLSNNCAALSWMKSVLKEKFMPMSPGDKYSIAIRSGKGGAKFSHDHATHCQYVMESLTLWEIVQSRIIDFWSVSEEDMLVNGEGMYRFTNTGQGYHRLCDAPKSYKLMARCVEDAHRKMGGWVGIKVIHLGDHDVPNPLVFIDKYTVIPRLTHPIMQTMMALKDIFDSSKPEEHPGVRSFLKAKYNSYEELSLSILSDFFKHGFDGSGDDGGSCIDGRLTSAWNWCHQLEKKPYYDAFVLTGFNGFD